jgi:hypothetical protein
LILVMVDFLLGSSVARQMRRPSLSRRRVPWKLCKTDQRPTRRSSPEWPQETQQAAKRRKSFEQGEIEGAEFVGEPAPLLLG